MNHKMNYDSPWTRFRVLIGIVIITLMVSGLWVFFVAYTVSLKDEQIRAEQIRCLQLQDVYLHEFGVASLEPVADEESELVIKGWSDDGWGEQFRFEFRRYVNDGVRDYYASVVTLSAAEANQIAAAIQRHAADIQ